MIEYNKANVKLSNIQLSKLKNAVKNNEGTTLRMSAKTFNLNDLSHELYLTARQTTKLRNSLENNMSSDMNLSRAQIKKVIISGGSLGSLLSKFAGLLLKTGLPLLKSIVKPLEFLQSSAAGSLIDIGIAKKIHGSGTTTLVINNEELNDIMKIIQALEDQGILLNGISKKIKNDIKNQSGGALGMLLGTLGASLLGNLLSGKGIYRAGHGITRTGHGIIRAGHGNKQQIKKKLKFQHIL